MGATMFDWLKRRTLSGPVRSPRKDHYERTVQNVGGEPRQLTLSDVDVEGAVVALVYRWSDDLNYEEADRLDTRARAYVSCAIPDAAIGAGLSFEAGPPHGQRPSWKIAGGSVPISLMAAGFDVREKCCWMHVGPTMGVSGKPSGRDSVAKGLASGFQSRVGQITV
jgi:hypothetical protein